MTVSLVLAKANADTVTVSSTLKVYPETHVRFDGKFYALAKGFDFTSTTNLSGVTYQNGTAAAAAISSGVTADGFTFTVDSGTDKITLPTNSSDNSSISEAVLTMFDLKWNDSSEANVYVAVGSIDSNGWGFSVYKETTSGQGSFLLGGTRDKWNMKDGSAWKYTDPATDDIFDQYFIYDNGTDAPKFGRGSVTEPFTVSDNDVSNATKFSAASPFTITFGDKDPSNAADPEYTLRAVNFYKAIQ